MSETLKKFLQWSMVRSRSQLIKRVTAASLKLIPSLSRFSNLKNKSLTQSTEQIIIDHSEWRKLESKRIREFIKKKIAKSKTPSRKSLGFEIFQ